MIILRTVGALLFVTGFLCYLYNQEDKELNLKNLLLFIGIGFGLIVGTILISISFLTYPS